jgi:3'-phosphoadenosine 5'-phosphosulfate sulfotransferase (PAPS reductase)/FAD synthetase
MNFEDYSELRKVGLLYMRTQSTPLPPLPPLTPLHHPPTLTKVEPYMRTLRELGAKAVLTGIRKEQVGTEYRGLR